MSTISDRGVEELLEILGEECDAQSGSSKLLLKSFNTIIALLKKVQIKVLHCTYASSVKF